MNSIAVSPAEPSKASPNCFRRNLLLAPLIVVLIGGLAFPLISLVADSVIVEGTFTLSKYAELFAGPHFSRVLLRTFETALITTFACLVIGYPTAYAIFRLQGFWSHILLVGVTIPFFTNTLIRSYAWISILGTNGLIDTILAAIGFDRVPQLVFNRTGMLIGMIQVQLPLMILTLFASMYRSDRALVSAAQSLGASPARAFWHAFVPSTRSGISAGCSIVFVSTLGFYITPTLLGSQAEHLIAQSIATQFSNLVDFSGAAAQATVLLVIVGLLLWVFRGSYALALPGASAPTRTSAKKKPSIIQCPVLAALLLNVAGKILGAVLPFVERCRWPILFMLLTCAMIYLMVPLIVVSIAAFGDARFLQFPPQDYSLRWFGEYFSSATWLWATAFSLVVAAVSAGLATIIGGMTAYWLVRAGGRSKNIVMLICLVPMVIPQITYALGMLFMLAPFKLVGSPWGFVLSYTVLGIPVAVLVIAASIRNLNPHMERAAMSLGAKPFSVAKLIVVPLIVPAIVSALVFAFLGAFDDVVIAMFLARPQSVTIALKMWQDIDLEVSPRTAAVAVVFFVATVLPLSARSLFHLLVRRPRNNLN